MLKFYRFISSNTSNIIYILFSYTFFHAYKQIYIIEISIYIYIYINIIYIYIYIYINEKQENQ